MTVPELRNELEYLSEQYGASKRWHDYLVHYHRLFSSRRASVSRVLEIGLRAAGQEGSSAGMWGEYFPNASIHGLDIAARNAELASERITITIMDSAAAGAGERFAAMHGGEFDLIIDDGSHWYGDQVASFLNFWPLVAQGGCYVCEDLVSGDGPHRYYSVRAFSELIDGLNYIAPSVSTGYWYAPEALPPDVHPLVNTVESVTFVRNAVFIVKGEVPHGNPWLASLAKAHRRPISETVARSGSSAVTLLRQAIRIAQDRYRRFLVPEYFAKPPGFISRLLGRIG